MGKIIKEIFIVLLLLIVVGFTIGILFYEFIPSENENISSVEYTQSEKVLTALSEIQDVSNTEDSKDDNTNSLLKSYSINKNDLNDYQSDNSYESGKKDPFAEYSETVAEEVIKNPNVNTTNTSTNTTKTQNTTNTAKPQNTTNTVTNTTKNNNTNTSSITSSEGSSLTEYLNSKNKNKNTAKDDTSTGTYFEKANSK